MSEKKFNIGDKVWVKDLGSGLIASYDESAGEYLIACEDGHTCWINPGCDPIQLEARATYQAHIEFNVGDKVRTTDGDGIIVDAGYGDPVRVYDINSYTSDWWESTDVTLVERAVYSPVGGAKCTG